MVNVNPIDGIKYGFRLMGYLIAVFLIGFVVMALGAALAEDGSAALGGLIAVVGFLTLFAGFAGMQYKIIADGVEQGVTAANTSSGSGRQGRQQTTSNQQTYSGHGQQTQQSRASNRGQQPRQSRSSGRSQQTQQSRTGNQRQRGQGSESADRGQQTYGDSQNESRGSGSSRE